MVGANSILLLLSRLLELIGIYLALSNSASCINKMCTEYQLRFTRLPQLDSAAN